MSFCSGYPFPNRPSFNHPGFDNLCRNLCEPFGIPVNRKVPASWSGFFNSQPLHERLFGVIHANNIHWFLQSFVLGGSRWKNRYTKARTASLDCEHALMQSFTAERNNVICIMTTTVNTSCSNRKRCNITFMLICPLQNAVQIIPELRC